VTAVYIAAEYDGIVQVTAAAEGITQVRFVPQDVAEWATPPIYMENSTVKATASALRRQN